MFIFVSYSDCFKVEGVGPNGRMFLFKNPSLEDQNATLWNMFYSMKMEKEALRKKLDYEVINGHL